MRWRITKQSHSLAPTFPVLDAFGSLIFNFAVFVFAKIIPHTDFALTTQKLLVKLNYLTKYLTTHWYILYFTRSSRSSHCSRGQNQKFQWGLRAKERDNSLCRRTTIWIMTWKTFISRPVFTNKSPQMTNPLPITCKKHTHFTSI